MKMGTIASPCPYDGGACCAPQLVMLRQPTILYYLCLPSAVAISQVAMTPAWPPASELSQRRRRCVLMIRRFWTCAIVTTVSALVSAGFSVVGLFGPSSSGSFERYAASRSVALLIAVLCC